MFVLVIDINYSGAPPPRKFISFTCTNYFLNITKKTVTDLCTPAITWKYLPSNSRCVILYFFPSGRFSKISRMIVTISGIDVALLDDP